MAWIVVVPPSLAAPGAISGLLPEQPRTGGAGQRGLGQPARWWRVRRQRSPARGCQRRI